MVATITALALVRLEREEDGEAPVALTERFVEAMEAEHREMGMGDPKLGRTVRKLVGSLGRRVELWRGAVGADWSEAARESVFGALPPTTVELELITDSLKQFWVELTNTPAEALAEGRIG
jgi:cytochrome b pre-mRNA-processing protein 3